MNRFRLGAAVLAGAIVAASVQGLASGHPARYGGTLFVALSGGDPGVLDPTLTTSNTSGEVLLSICQSLYTYDVKARLVPQLAAAMPAISKDKLTYTIPIRKGILFNDGTPLDAPAVVTSIQRMITLPGSLRASSFDSVDSVTASGPYTVVIHLRERFTPLTAHLASQDGTVMSPTQLQKLGSNFGSNPVCVGPYMYDGRIVGDNVTVIKSPYYYDKYAAHFDKIVYRPANDAAAAVAALRAGDLQLMDQVDAAQLPALQQNSNVQLTGPRGSAGPPSSSTSATRTGWGVRVRTPVRRWLRVRFCVRPSRRRSTVTR